MNLIRNNLLNTSKLSGASFLFGPDDGAGVGAGETPTPAAPAAEPTVGDTTNVEATPEADIGGDMFAMPSDDALFALDDTGEVTTPPPASAPPTAPAQVAPATPPAGTTPAAPVPGAPPAPPATPTAAAVPPAGAVATPPAAATPPAPETPPAAAEQPAPDIIALLDQGRPQITAQLKQMYAISDADAEAIGVVDKGPLEALAANLHFNVMKANIQMLQQTLPNAIAHALDMRSREDELTGQFYAANPELDRKTDHSVVTHYAKMFWAANPQGTLADMNKQVGTMVKAHLNKLTATATAIPPATTPGVAPKKVPMKPSFTPATPGSGAPASKAPPQGGDIWGQLAERMMNPEEE